ncbi:fimbrial protein [Providencia rettgeri]|uniref:fimbrial protein n=1 Tax=Providencia rettgeri TaxID=587 RepID=UPI0032DA1DCF
MNKYTILAAVVASIVCGSASANTVNGGKVTFNGEVTSGACAVSGSDTDKLVTLDTVRAASFNGAAGQLANAVKPFTISLLDCDTDAADTVQITFSGQKVDGNQTVLANSAGAGSAQGVALQLFGPDGAELALDNMSSTVNVAGTTTIPLSVDYISTDTTVTAGKVQGVANFTLTYN